MDRTDWENSLKDLEEALAYTFKDPSHLKSALTHSSFVNENNEDMEHNERLEFLGDAVLELCVSQELFRRFPQEREGKLTKLRAQMVSRGALEARARELKLNQYIRLGHGEEEQGGRTRSSILADAFEATLGAVFLDGGYEAAHTFVSRRMDHLWDKANSEDNDKDYKSLLQELTQQKFRELPVYKLIGSYGPEHAKIFEVSLTLPTKDTVMATGKSLKRAEQAAAELGLQLLTEQES